mmetsp:Transcript_77185/g.170438  ORF Transcript_77185/g.170438 Transcript_77185/m.170438 type:complete len:270 (-) Transcript_77185:173-982(-)
MMLAIKGGHHRLRGRIRRVNAHLLLKNRHQNSKIIHLGHDLLELLHLPNISSDVDTTLQFIHNLSDGGIVASGTIGKRFRKQIARSHIHAAATAFVFLHIINLSIWSAFCDGCSVQASHSPDGDFIWAQLHRAANTVQMFAATHHIPGLGVECGLFCWRIQLCKSLDLGRVRREELSRGHLRWRPRHAALGQDQRDLRRQLCNLFHQERLLLALRRVAPPLHARAQLVADLLGVGSIDTKEGSDATLSFFVHSFQIGTHTNTEAAARIV